MATETKNALEAIKRELRFIGREVSNLATNDFEAVDAISRSLIAIDRSIFDLELDAEPANEDDLLAA